MDSGLSWMFPAASAHIGNTKELGKVLYTQYVFAFEVAAVILLVAMIAAVALTIRRRKDRKYFDPADAVKVKSRDRVRVVRMKSESARNDAGAPGAQAVKDQS